MNKLCTLILMLFSLASLPVMAAGTDADKDLGFFVEAQTTSRHVTSVLGWYQHDFTDSLGFYALVDKESDGYREWYVGPKWKPLDWLEVGIGIGRETIPCVGNAIRRNAYFLADTEKFVVLGTFENGGSGPWHKVTVVYKLLDSINAGVMNESLLGTGPRVEYNITKKFQIWGAMLRDRGTGKSTGLLAVNYSF